MKCNIVKIESLSGPETSIYSLYINDDEITLYESFISENQSLFKSELIDISKRLRSIGSSTGAREQFFKLHEGDLGDGVCALYDNLDKNLRLYCIRYATTTIILGGGGEKPKTMRKLQESEKLTEENYLLRELSKEITKRLKNKEIRLSYDSNDFTGTLEFNTDEE